MNDFYTTTIRNIIKTPNLVEVTPSTLEALLDLPREETAAMLQALFREEEDPSTQSRIFDALMRLPDFDQVGFLLEAFPQQGEDWQMAFCRQLGNYGDLRAVEFLAEILSSHEDGDYRYIAAEQLEHHAGLEIIPLLEKVIENDTGEDYGGFPVADRARETLEGILARTSKRKTLRGLLRTFQESQFQAEDVQLQAIELALDWVWKHFQSSPVLSSIHTTSQSTECRFALQRVQPFGLSVKGFMSLYYERDCVLNIHCLLFGESGRIKLETHKSSGSIFVVEHRLQHQEGELLTFWQSDSYGEWEDEVTPPTGGPVEVVRSYDL